MTDYSPQFKAAAEFTLVAEGILSDNPKDAGGLTKFGVTQATWDDYRKFVSDGDARPASVRDIEVTDALDVYFEFFWKPIAALPSEVQGPAFDFAVNSGVEQAVKTFQSILCVTADGELGPVTLARAGAVKISSLRKLRNQYVSARIDFLLNLAQHQSNDVTFIEGWFKRVSQLYDFAY